MKEKVHREYRHKRLIVSILSLIVLLMIYLFKDATLFILQGATFIALVLSFYTLDHIFQIHFKIKHYIFIIVIGTFALMLGHLYYYYPQYDKIQHAIFPILMCSIMFFMINKLNLALKWKITFTVLSVAGLLGFFEIGEYVLDLLFDLKLQGVFIHDFSGLEKLNLVINPLDDTMVDLAFGMLGCAIYAVYAYFKYHKYHKTI